MELEGKIIAVLPCKMEFRNQQGRIGKVKSMLLKQLSSILKNVALGCLVKIKSIH